MGIFDRFRKGPSAALPAPAEPAVSPRAAVQSSGPGITIANLDDPRLIDFLRTGMETASGVTISIDAAMKNTTVMRCVSLIAFSIGMLPLHLRRKDNKEKAGDHPLFRLLHRRPNGWQTAFEFRSLMEQWALQEGNAYALKVPSATGGIAQLIPMAPNRVEARLTDSFTVAYRYTRPDGRTRDLRQDEVFHLRCGLSADGGVHGMSLVKKAAEAIGLALQTERAAARLFKNGMLVGGMMSVKDRLSEEAFNRLKQQMDEREGADEAHRWIIGEEGLEAKPFSQTGRESQHIEMRKLQVEEIARAFGVPRPLLGVDDTSWGSGIDVLGQMFVRYGLNPWFEAWEQAIARDLMTEAEQDVFEAKFNPGALLRGNMKDQAEFFAKALGSGGHYPWLHPEEIRDISDLPWRDDLPSPPNSKSERETDEPA